MRVLIGLRRGRIGQVCGVGRVADENMKERRMATEDRPRRRYLTVAEVAETMRVSKMTVYRLTKSGELPAVRVGRSYRVPQDALDSYLERSMTDGSQADVG
jgi:excisionase family DNA binding protein